MVDLAANQLGIKHIKIPLQGAHFLTDLRALVHHHDGPISTISYFAHNQLVKAMSGDGFKVSVSGTGADELFTGYYDHHNLHLHDIASNSEL